MITDYIAMCQQLLDSPAQGLIQYNLAAQITLHKVLVPLTPEQQTEVKALLTGHYSVAKICAQTGIPMQTIRALQRNPDEVPRIKCDQTYTLGELFRLVGSLPSAELESLFRLCMGVEHLLLKICEIKKLGNIELATVYTSYNESPYSGKYTIAGTEYAFRSKLEAKYACWLQARKEIGAITGWSYRTHKFELEGVGRMKDWQPDFCVEAENTATWVEVAAWANELLKRKIALLRQANPFIEIAIVETTWFEEHAEDIAACFVEAQWTRTHQVVAVQ